MVGVVGKLDGIVVCVGEFVVCDGGYGLCVLVGCGVFDFCVYVDGVDLVWVVVYL